MVEEAHQFLGIEEPDAAGREETLEATPARASGAEDAHDGEASVGFENATGLAQSAGRILELVQGSAADGSGEAGVGEREAVGVRPGEGGVHADLPGAPGGLLEHGGGDVYADHPAPTVESAGQAARVEPGRATEVEVAAAALQAYEVGDHLQLAVGREGFTGEEGEGMDAPERLVGGPGAGEEVGEVGGVGRADASFQQVDVSVLYLIYLAGGGGAELAAHDRAVRVDPSRVDEAPGIRGARTDDSEEVLAEQL